MNKKKTQTIKQLIIHKKKETKGEAKQIYKSPTYPLTSFKNNAK